MQFRFLESKEEILAAFPLMAQLRSHLTSESFQSLYEAAQKESGYTLVGAFEGQECVALIGYRVLSDFVHGRHLYIDDLVVTSDRRSQGVGEKLLDFAEGKAREFGCEGLRLCTGVENTAGIKFYERCGWQPKAFAFKKPVRHDSSIE